jgi:hypothetical protein
MAAHGEVFIRTERGLVPIRTVVAVEQAGHPVQLVAAFGGQTQLLAELAGNVVLGESDGRVRIETREVGNRFARILGLVFVALKITRGTGKVREAQVVGGTQL